jgi:hypothetical protein
MPPWSSVRPSRRFRTLYSTVSSFVLPFALFQHILSQFLNVFRPLRPGFQPSPEELAKYFRVLSPFSIGTALDRNSNIFPIFYTKDLNFLIESQKEKRRLEDESLWGWNCFHNSPTNYSNESWRRECNTVRDTADGRQMWKCSKFLVCQLASLSVNDLTNQYVDIQSISQATGLSVRQ